MSQRRLTKQRQIILEELRSVSTHPTAEEIYEMVVKRISNISFATVYRNLDVLEDLGEILKLKAKSPDGKARYDGNLGKHCHLICRKCGKIKDIFDCKNITLQSRQIKKSGFKIVFDQLEISGICEDCYSIFN